jgi:tight adherence protein B
MIRHDVRLGRGRRGRDDPEAAAGVLDAVSREIRSGTSLTVAVRGAPAHHRSVLPALGAALDRGDPISSALDAAAPRSPSETVFHRSLVVAAATGGDVVAVLESGAEVLRERHAWALERRAQSAQARVSALVLTAVPVAFAALGLATSDRVRDAYSSVGVTVPLTAVGVVVNLFGWWWMRRLVSGAT